VVRDAGRVERAARLPDERVAAHPDDALADHRIELRFVEDRARRGYSPGQGRRHALPDARMRIGLSSHPLHFPIDR
jgi:hypothetical protein